MSVSLTLKINATKHDLLDVKFNGVVIWVSQSWSLLRHRGPSTWLTPELNRSAMSEDNLTRTSDWGPSRETSLPHSRLISNSININWEKNDLCLRDLGRGGNFASEGLTYTKRFSFSDNNIRFVCAIKCVQKCPRRFYRTQCANESSKLFLWVFLSRSWTILGHNNYAYASFYDKRFTKTSAL